MFGNRKQLLSAIDGGEGFGKASLPEFRLRAGSWLPILVSLYLQPQFGPYLNLLNRQLAMQS